MKGIDRPDVKRRFAGSQSDAAKRKGEMKDEHGLKRDEIKVDEVEIPTNKTDLIEWLNKNHI